MATYVLIPGAASGPWYWHRVVPLLTALGHDVITPDLPTSDEHAGLDRYVEVVLGAVGHRPELVLVGQSMGALTATLVAARLPTQLLALVVPMVPQPGEAPGQWWGATGQAQAQRDLAVDRGREPSDDPLVLLLHDVDPAIATESARHVRPQSEAPFGQPWPLPSWPAVPTRVLVGRHDRLFPLAFQQRVVSERLGQAPDIINTGHLPALARPDELVTWLEAQRHHVTDVSP